MRASLHPFLVLFAVGCGAATSSAGTTPDPAHGCVPRPADPSTTECGYVVDGCCYATEGQACAAAGCAPGGCIVLESFPAQIQCGAGPIATSSPGTAKQEDGSAPVAGDVEPRAESPGALTPETSMPSTRAGDRIVRMARRMVRRRTIVRGSCFDYVDRVFSRAGYGDDDRERVYSSAIAGPYADLGLVAPGDWLYIVTHPERDPPATHSVIFVRWLDRAAGRAEVASYAGNGARRPGGLVPYDVTRTYRITRASGRPWH